MKVIRDYLTSDELNYIVNAMLEKETALEREIVKVGLIAQLVTDDEDIDKLNNCNDIYDKVVADNTINFSAIINNYDIIDKIVAEEMGTNKILKDFATEISTKLDESIKNLDLNLAINQLKELAEKEENGVKPIKERKNGRSTK